MPKERLELSEFSRTVLFGSCFTQHIGQRMIDCFWPTNINPFGILYNPQSIALAINCICKQVFHSQFLFKDNFDMWHSWLHSGLYDASDSLSCLSNIKKEIDSAHNDLERAKALFITFGTNHFFKLKDSSIVVGNCHKQPSNNFIDGNLSVDEIVEIWKKTIKQILMLNVNTKIVFTVSPYKYTRHGLHSNQLAKATLLLAINKLCTLFPKTCLYFPAYEIVTDELRDYRFFSSDMIHPSELAIDYVWECFSSWAMTQKALEVSAEALNISKALKHRPLKENSLAFKKFKLKTEQQYKAFIEKYNLVDLNPHQNSYKTKN